MTAQDTKWIDAVSRRRPGLVDVVSPDVLTQRYGKKVHLTRPRGATAAIYTVHHTASQPKRGTEGILQSTWDYHIRTLGWATGGYAVGIDTEGRIAVLANPFSQMTYNAGERWNPVTLAIVCVGNFHVDIVRDGVVTLKAIDPPGPMLQSLYACLISADDVAFRPWRGHRELPRSTACPGDRLLPHVQRMRGGAFGDGTPRPEIYG